MWGSLVVADTKLSLMTMLVVDDNRDFFFPSKSTWNYHIGQFERNDDLGQSFIKKIAYKISINNPQILLGLLAISYFIGLMACKGMRLNVVADNLIVSINDNTCPRSYSRIFFF